MLANVNRVAAQGHHVPKRSPGDLVFKEYAEHLGCGEHTAPRLVHRAGS
jgi:hypothetical protein